MPKSKKPVSGKEPINRVPETKEAKQRRNKTNTIITAAAILAVIVAVIIVSWYLIYKAPLQKAIIKVNDENVKIEYFLKRCLMSASPSDTQGMLQTIIYELLIKQGAPQYGITVTEADIDQALRDEANSLSTSDSTDETNTTSTTEPTTTTPTVTLSDAEFNEWYRQQLNQSQLSEKEFRELVKINIMSQRLQAYLADRVPTTAEQVHLYDILALDYNTAADVQKRIEEGEDFMTLASEVSLDSSTSEKGGDMGWIPIHVLDESLEYTVSNLDIGVVSEPVQTSALQQQAQSSGEDQPYLLLMITEKAVAREVDPQYMDALKNRAMTDWMNAQMSSQKIALFGKGSTGGYDSETDAWIQYQIEKLKKSRGIAETTATN
ncbi:MAG: peptidylprolyl isomerase [Dehalococcoidales bacterium]|nr:peptidylprolyl isomerase [Dehalococcoidales bacterium]